MNKIKTIVVGFFLTWVLPLSLFARSVIPAQAYQYRARLIREAHANWGLDAPIPILAGQIEQESGWRTDAKSGVGALGICQFMPGTADWMNRLYHLGGAAPLDPGWAIRALVLYDYRLFLDSGKIGFRPFQEQMAAALSGYNGGEGWLTKDITLTRQRSSCNVSLWFGCVERYSLRTGQIFKENRGYPRSIILEKAPKYGLDWQ
jgi:soluble lytic murein transglycosylase-like protein